MLHNFITIDFKLLAALNLMFYLFGFCREGPFQAKRNASGILYNTYLRKRKNLIKRNVTTPFRKRRATSDSSDLSDVEPARPTCPLIDLSIIDESKFCFLLCTGFRKKTRTHYHNRML